MKPFFANLSIILACACSSATAQIVFEVQYLDPPGVGFNDTRAAPAAPGNPGVTFGEQRRFLFEKALADWGWRLDSPVSVRMEAFFQDFGCTGFAGVGNWLAGTINAPNAAFPDSWVQINLANARAGFRIFDSPQLDAEARVRFNLLIDDPDDCSPPRTFWYGFDPAAEVAPGAGQVAFYALALHEIAHTLGFGTQTDGNTGQWAQTGGGTQFPDTWDHLLFDLDANQSWIEMTSAQRAASARNQPELVWGGAAVADEVENWAIFPPRLSVAPPIDGQTVFGVFVHGFAPYLQVPGLTAELVLAEPANACQPLTNAAQIAGRVALVDRGSCGFQVKQDQAAAAGAVALILADNVDPDTPPGGGAQPIRNNTALVLTDPNGIPYYSVTLPVGDTLKSALPGLTVTLDADLSAERLGTRDGFVSMHAPETFQPGSSVAHFGLDLLPHALMRTGTLNLRFAGGVDLIPALFQDMGWTGADLDILFRDDFDANVIESP